MCRKDTSDWTVFRSVFVQREYAFLESLEQPKLIVDCGAYVGYSTAYFLTAFQDAHVIAVEPDAANFAVLSHNIAPYRDRVTTLHSALWSHPTGLVVRPGVYGDGRAWATQVAECGPGDREDIHSIDIPTLLERSPFERIDILKLDIERAEAVVFGDRYEAWIDKVNVFVIELHDDECRDVFFDALSTREFEFSVAGENTIARRVDSIET